MNFSIKGILGNILLNFWGLKCFSLGPLVGGFSDPSPKRMECPLSFSVQGKVKISKRDPFAKYGPLRSHCFIKEFYPRIKGSAKIIPFLE